MTSGLHALSLGRIQIGERLVRREGKYILGRRIYKRNAAPCASLLRFVRRERISSLAEIWHNEDYVAVVFF